LEWRSAEVVKNIGMLIASGVGEGVEETLESLLQPFLQRLTYDKNAETFLQNPKLLLEAGYEGMLGFIIGVFSRGTSNAVDLVDNLIHNNIMPGEKLMETAGVSESEVLGAMAIHEMGKMTGNGVAEVDESGLFAADARDKYDEITRRSTIKIQSGVACFPDGDPLNENVQMVVPLENHFDVAMHGTATAVGFGTTEVNMSPRLLANYILHSEGYNGQNIRLLSCSTGKSIGGEYCFAEELANILGVEVYAPNDTLYIFPNGTFSVGDDGSGSFVLYKPNQRRRIR